MGKGNCNVRTQDGEAIFYIDYDYIHLYSDKKNPDSELLYGNQIDTARPDDYEYDADASQNSFDETMENLKEQFMRKFKSLSTCDVWIGRHKHAILENKCFYIALEDNEWSIAVELLMKEDANKGLQRKNASNFARGIRRILLKNFETISLRTGAWTSHPITAKDAKRLDKEEKAAEAKAKAAATDIQTTSEEKS